MNNILHFFVIATALAGALAAISIWSPRKLPIKMSAVIVVALFLPVAYLSLVNLLSRPKPITLEWAKRDLTEATVLGANLREGQGIYLWLQVSGVEEPRAYVLPWDQELAQQLHSAQREADSSGTGVRMRKPFTNGRDESIAKFYAPPQPASPPKPAPNHQPMIFKKQQDQQPGNGA